MCSKKKRKITIILTSFLILLSLIPFEAFAISNSAGTLEKPEVFKGRVEELSKFKRIKKIFIQDENGNDEIGYCYNYNLMYPQNNENKLTYGLSSYLDKDFRIAAVQRVIYAGYPNNMLGIKGKYSLNDDEFYVITQHAVWKFTDGSINNDGISGSYDKQAFLDEIENLPKERQNTLINALDELITAAVNKDGSPNTRTPSNIDLYFYKANIDSYQDILSARFAKESKHKKTKVKIKKIWKNSSGKETEDVPVDSISVDLYRDGTKIDSLKLSKANNWVASFDNLPVSKTLDSKPYEYSVKEAEEKDGKILLNKKSYNVLIEKADKNSFVITNKESTPYTPLTPANTKISVKKIWKNSSGKETEDVPVDSISVDLYRDGTKIDSLKLSKANNWVASFDNLPVSKTLDSKPYEYSVKEAEEKDGKILLNKKIYNVLIEKADKNSFVITNKESTPYTPLTPANTKISVKKIWKNSSGKETEDVPVDSISVDLYRDGTKIDSLKLSKANNWVASFDNLPVSKTLDSKPYEYSVKEAEEKDGKILLNKKSYNVLIEKADKNSFVITNKESTPHTPLTPANTKISVKKIWKNSSGKETEDVPVDSISVDLYRDGTKIDSLKLSKANNWVASFDNLPVSKTLDSKPYEYSVKEAEEKDGKILLNKKSYNVLIEKADKNSFVITNKESTPYTPLTPANTKISVKKIWKNSSGKETEDVPVDSISVDLYRDGTKIDSLKLSKANNWVASFDNLPVSKTLDSKPYEYSVKEAEEKDGKILLNKKSYNVLIEKADKNSFVITNKESDDFKGLKTTPKTMDGENLFFFLSLSVLSGLLIFVLSRKQKC